MSHRFGLTASISLSTGLPTPSPSTRRDGRKRCIGFIRYMNCSIDSSQFEIPEGHENSARNPLPSRDIVPKIVEAKAFHIPYEFFSVLDGLHYERYEIQKDDLSTVPIPTQQRGFYFASPHYFYSKASMEGIGEPLKQDGLTWLEEDLDEKCTHL